MASFSYTNQSNASGALSKGEAPRLPMPVSVVGYSGSMFPGILPPASLRKVKEGAEQPLETTGHGTESHENAAMTLQRRQPPPPLDRYREGREGLTKTEWESSEKFERNMLNKSTSQLTTKNSSNFANRQEPAFRRAPIEYNRPAFMYSSTYDGSSETLLTTSLAKQIGRRQSETAMPHMEWDPSSSLPTDSLVRQPRKELSASVSLAELFNTSQQPSSTPAPVSSHRGNMRSKKLLCQTPMSVKVDASGPSSTYSESVASNSSSAMGNRWSSQSKARNVSPSRFPARQQGILEHALLHEPTIHVVKRAKRMFMGKKRDVGLRSIVMTSNAHQGQGNLSAKLANLTGATTIGQARFHFDHNVSESAFAFLHCFKISNDDAKEEDRLAINSNSYVAVAETAHQEARQQLSPFGLRISGLPASLTVAKSRADEQKAIEWLLHFDSKHRMLQWQSTVRALIIALCEADQEFRSGFQAKRNEVCTSPSSCATPLTPMWSPRGDHSEIYSSDSDEDDSVSLYNDSRVPSSIYSQLDKSSTMSMPKDLELLSVLHGARPNQVTGEIPIRVSSQQTHSARDLNDRSKYLLALFQSSSDPSKGGVPSSESDGEHCESLDTLDQSSSSQGIYNCDLSEAGSITSLHRYPSSASLSRSSARHRSKRMSKRLRTTVPLQPPHSAPTHGLPTTPQDDGKASSSKGAVGPHPVTADNDNAKADSRHRKNISTLLQADDNASNSSLKQNSHRATTSNASTLSQTLSELTSFLDSLSSSDYEMSVGGSKQLSRFKRHAKSSSSSGDASLQKTMTQTSLDTHFSSASEGGPHDNVLQDKQKPNPERADSPVDPFDDGEEAFYKTNATTTRFQVQPQPQRGADRYASKNKSSTPAVQKGGSAFPTEKWHKEHAAKAMPDNDAGAMLAAARELAHRHRRLREAEAKLVRKALDQTYAAAVPLYDSASPEQHDSAVGTAI